MADDQVTAHRKDGTVRRYTASDSIGSHVIAQIVPDVCQHSLPRARRRGGVAIRSRTSDHGAGQIRVVRHFTAAECHVVRAALHAAGVPTMGMRFYFLCVLVAILVLLIAIRLRALAGSDRRRLHRAADLLRRGMLPSKLEEKLVSEGLDRATASDTVGQALKALTPAKTTVRRSAAPAASTASPRRNGSTTPLPEIDESSSAPLPAAPFARGNALLFRAGDAVGAIEAYTQAIELDPLYPNAYLGRAVAHRRLGHFAAALEDEKQAEQLGGPEKSAWDRLVNRSRHRWHWDFDNLDWKRTDPLSRQAVLFSTLIRQIVNGGLPQWVFNGYWRWIDDLIEAAREVDTPATRELADILDELSRQLAVEPAAGGSVTEDDSQGDAASDEQRDELLVMLLEFEERYHRCESAFVEDVERWIEEKAAARGDQPS